MTPPAPHSSERRALPERRANIERRISERRLRMERVSNDRRGPAERRRPFDRRETAEGHVRNAIQVLEGLLADAELDAEHTASVRTAIGRLWLAVREVDRLTASRRHLEFRLRRRRPSSGDEQHSA